MRYFFYFIVASTFISLAANAQSIDATIAGEFLIEGKLSKAIATCEKAIKEDPNDTDCIAILKKARQTSVKKKKDESDKEVAEYEKQRQKDLALAVKRSSKECVRARLIDQYCSKILQIGIQQNLIDREKRVSRDTGAVNLTSLNQAGSNKALLEDQAANLAQTLKSKVDYRALSEECVLEKNEYGFPKSYEHPLIKNIESICGK